MFNTAFVRSLRRFTRLLSVFEINKEQSLLHITVPKLFGTRIILLEPPSIAIDVMHFFGELRLWQKHP